MIQLQPLEPDTLPTTRSVLVAIPAHNEDRFIGSVVLKLRSYGFDVLVVDDGSRDRTAEVAMAAGAAVVSHATNHGKTGAVRTAFQHAAAAGVDGLVLMDGDSQHDPAHVRRVLAPVLAGEADMVVGSRFAGQASDIPAWRMLGQHTLTIATNVGSGLHLSDTESGFRAFSRRAIQEMRFRGNGFSLEPELQFQAKAHGWKVAEVPIQVSYEIPIKRNPLVQGARTLSAVLKLSGFHHPLIFFCGPGGLSLLAGFALGLWVVRRYDEVHQLATGLALVTVMLTSVGVLAVFVGIMLFIIGGLFRTLTDVVESQGRSEAPRR